jgi:hypothetical protein
VERVLSADHQLHHLLQREHLIAVASLQRSGRGYGGAELLTQVSSVAWQHINFYGRYEFTTNPTPIDLETIVEALAQHPIVPAPEES